VPVRGRLDGAMALDTFISYSSKDKTAADAACAVLERAGVRCWIAPRDIRPGQEYGHAIIEAIDQCRVMVLIFSANANDSRQIHREIERAVSKGVPIIPLRIEEVVPTRSMEYFLGAIHWLDALTPPLERHLQRLAEAVKALLQIDVAAAPLRDNSSQASTTVRHAEPAMQGGGRAAWLTGAGRLLILVLGVAAACIAPLIGGVWYYLMREPAAVTASAREPAPVIASDPQILGYREFREPAAVTAPVREPASVTASDPQILGYREFREPAAVTAPVREPAPVAASDPQVLGYREFREPAPVTAPVREPAPVTASDPQVLGYREFREPAPVTAPVREPAPVTASDPQVLGYREFREPAAVTAPAQALAASLSQTVQSGIKTERLHNTSGSTDPACRSASW
jgi:TIR domain